MRRPITLILTACLALGLAGLSTAPSAGVEPAPDDDFHAADHQMTTLEEDEALADKILATPYIKNTDALQVVYGTDYWNWSGTCGSSFHITTHWRMGIRYARGQYLSIRWARVNNYAPRKSTVTALLFKGDHTGLSGTYQPSLSWAADSDTYKRYVPDQYLPMTLKYLDDTIQIGTSGGYAPGVDTTIGCHRYDVSDILRVYRSETG